MRSINPIIQVFAISLIFYSHVSSEMILNKEKISNF